MHRGLCALRFSFALAVTVAAASIVAGRTGAIASPRTPKTLRRLHDPVIIETGRLGDLPDRRTAHYRLYAFHDGRLEPIPFQFDARDESGDLLLSGEDEGSGPVFDDNDELVFMAKDSGDRAGSSDLPTGADVAREIELGDPTGDGRGWAYLVHFPGHVPPPSPVRYATFDPATNEVRALFYEVTYFPGRNFFTSLRITRAGGGTGENILDRMRVRLRPTFSLLFTKWSPLFTEESFTVKVDGVKNGPVRAIRRVRQWLDLGRFFPQAPGGTVYTYYYLSSFVSPSRVKIPWLVLKALRGFRFEGVSDLGEKAHGMTYWDAAHPRGLRFTGHNHAGVEAAQDHDWYVISGPSGACIHAFVIPPEWRSWGIVRGAVFVDEDGARGKAGGAGRHAAGYRLLNMTKIRKPGTYAMSLAVVILPGGYHPGEELEALAMLKRPLTIRVGPVAR